MSDAFLSLDRCLGIMPLIGQLLVVFVVGAVVGSFLNVCVARLPLEKSLFWPGSRCSHCLQPIRWYDNVPLVSYCVLRGRCRVCGERFSARYFVVELLTAAGFVGLYYLEVVANVHHFDERVLGPDRYDSARYVTFGYHALLFCFLLVATFCDIEYQAIPLSLTVTGTLIGLVGATVLPWPWPYEPAQATPPQRDWSFAPVSPRTGLYPWPVWGPLPEWLQPGGNWQTGLATGLAGMLAGTLVLRAVRLLFGLGVGADYMEPVDPERVQTRGWVGRFWSWLGRVGGKALGLGDADLMMMAGSFLGWQPVIVALFVGVFPGLIFGLVQLALRGNRAMPFGPALAIGVVITWLSWYWIGRQYQALFFNWVLLLLVAVVGCLGMLFLAYMLRMLRVTRQ